MEITFNNIFTFFNIKKNSLLIVILVLSFFKLEGQNDTIKMNRYMDYLKIAPDVDSFYIDKRIIYKFRKYSPQKSIKKFNNNYLNVYFFTKSILFINNTLIIKGKKNKKTLKNYQNYEIANIEYIPKEKIIKKFGWWYSRHGGYKLKIRKIE